METALQGGRFLEQPRIYYFHNCSVDYLYRDPGQDDEQAISDSLIVLVFSDGGAARGGDSSDRLELTEIFYAALHKIGIK